MAEGRPSRLRTVFKVLLFLMFLFMAPIVVAIFIGTKMAPEQHVVEKGTVLELNLAGELAEAPEDPLLAKFFGGTGTSLWQIRESLRKAAADPNVAALRLTIGPLEMGWGELQELVSELDTFRASGKPVHALLRTDLISDAEYYLATGADRIWLSPGTGAVVNGLAIEVTFWRGTLEKLHVVPEILMFKEYKSAGEPFKNKEMSPYMREAMEAVLSDIQAEFITRVAERRKLEPVAVATFLAQGIQSAGELKSSGLVDELGYDDQLEDALAAIAGVDTYAGLNLADYDPKQPAVVNPDAATLALIFGEGPIVSSEGQGGLFNRGDSVISGPDVAAAFRTATDDDDVKAIVFRVNSPGGSPVGSDLIWREIQRAKQAGKPVIVSMSTLAGSGGYWVAMGADAIVAQPTTITGSIGVLFTKFDISGLFEWAGAHVDTVKTSPSANIISLNEPLNPETQARAEAWLDSTYQAFTGKVAEGRNLPLDEVQNIAKGRIWSGRDALELKLVDQLGGLDAAITLAREKGSLRPDAEIVIYPEHKTLAERLLSGDFNMGAFTQAPDTNLLILARELAAPQVRVEMPGMSIR